MPRLFLGTMAEIYNFSVKSLNDRAIFKQLSCEKGICIGRAKLVSLIFKWVESKHGVSRVQIWYVGLLDIFSHSRCSSGPTPSMDARCSQSGRCRVKNLVIQDPT